MLIIPHFLMSVNGSPTHLVPKVKTPPMSPGFLSPTIQSAKFNQFQLLRMPQVSPVSIFANTEKCPWMSPCGYLWSLELSACSPLDSRVRMAGLAGEPHVSSAHRTIAPHPTPAQGVHLSVLQNTLIFPHVPTSYPLT